MKYHFGFSIVNGESSVKLDLPTAPMYIEGSTYSGRCKMWLKRVDIGSTDFDIWATGLGNATLGLEFDTTAYNRFLLNTGSVKNNSVSRARFNIPLTSETLVVHQLNKRERLRGFMEAKNRDSSAYPSHPFYQNIAVAGDGTQTIRKVIPLIARQGVATGTDAGDGGGGVTAGVDQVTQFITLRPSLLPAVTDGIGTALAASFERLYAGGGADGSTGTGNMVIDSTSISANFNGRNDVGRTISYHNNVMNDNDCMIIGAPWGSSINATIRAQSLGVAGAAFDLADETPIAITSRAIFEIVIEPMTNDESVEVSI